MIYSRLQGFPFLDSGWENFNRFFQKNIGKKAVFINQSDSCKNKKKKKKKKKNFILATTEVWI